LSGAAHRERHLHNVVGALPHCHHNKENLMKFIRQCLCLLAIAPCMMAASAQGKPVVQFIATGGTIAMKVDPVTKGVVPAISGDDLMQTVPDAGKYATIEVNNFSAMSANYVEAKWWTRLTKAVDDALARPEVAGVVIATAPTPWKKRRTGWT
jgi:L-asparaginase